MANQRQKKLAKGIVSNIKKKNPLNGMQLLISAGYSEVTARASSTRTIEQKGVQEELIKMGFTEDAAKETVTKVMLNEFVSPGDRLKAADMVFKVSGSYAPEKQEHSGNLVFMPMEIAKKNGLPLSHSTTTNSE